VPQVSSAAAEDLGITTPYSLFPASKKWAARVTPCRLAKRYNGSMDAILRKYTSFDEMKADEYRYWQSRPVHERMDAVEEMIQTAYAIKGWEIEPNVPRLHRPFVRLSCPWR